MRAALSSKISFIVLCVLILAVSCSQAAPRISLVQLRLVYRGNSTANYETLSCFAMVSDPDGFADLGELHIIHDKDFLYWTLTEDDWLLAKEGEQDWIGTHSIRMPRDEFIPRGLYRILLIDKAGERFEQLAQLDVPLAMERPFPTLKIEDGRYTIQSEYPTNTVLAYNEKGDQIKSVTIQRKEGRLGELNLGRDARSLALWSVDTGTDTAAFTERIVLP